MSLGENLQQFLTHKISDIKIKRKELLMKCGLKQSIFNKMLDGSFSNPKLTDYFMILMVENFELSKSSSNH